MRVELIQFIRPNGRREQIWCDGIDDSLADKVKQITDAGLRFTAEAINGTVSLCIENDEEDLAIEMAMNRPDDEQTGPKATLEKMIRAFKIPEAASHYERPR